MKAWVIIGGAAIALAGCSGGSSEKSVKEMLQANDPMVCASSDVQRSALIAIYGGYREFITGGGKPLAFEAVNSIGLNKDIHEVSCSANVSFPPMLLGGASIPEVVVPITYAVRPTLGDDSEFIVNAASTTNYIYYRLGQYVLTNSTDSGEEANPTSANAGPAQEFTEAEKTLIALANDAWVGYRNGDPDAEAKFDQLLGQLLKGDICWGEVDQVQAEYKFHRCGPNSLQKQPA